MHAFMAGATRGQPGRQVHGLVHRLLVRPAQGQGIGVRDDRPGCGRALRRALRRLRRRQGARRARRSATSSTPRTSIRARWSPARSWHMEPSIEKALAAVQGGTFTAEDYGPLSNLAAGGCTVAPLNAELVPAGRGRQGPGQRGGDPLRRAARSRSTTASPSRASDRRDGGHAAPVVLRLEGITKRFGDAARQRRHRPRAAPGRDPGAARRERRRQDHADEHPVRPLRRRRRAGAGRRRARARCGRCRRARRMRRWRPGIGMVHQHFALAANLSVLDNVMLGTEPLWRWRRHRRCRPAQARAR